MHENAHSQRGFTLIEIISVLVILGILAAVAVPKYFDLQEESEKKAALGSVAEAQARIQLRFGQLILQGNTCEKAVLEVNELKKLADSTDDGNLFGEFILSAAPITTAGVAVSAKRKGNSGNTIDTGAKLYVPDCESTAGGTTHSFGNATDMQTIIKIMQQEKTTRLDSGAQDKDSSHTSNTIESLKNAGIDLEAMGATSWSLNNNKLYWTTSDISSIASGTKIPVMAYNTKTGTYTVWSATILSHSEDTIGTYNRIEKENTIYKAANDAEKTGQTYENALQWFKDASADTSWIQ